MSIVKSKWHLVGLPTIHDSFHILLFVLLTVWLCQTQLHYRSRAGPTEPKIIQIDIPISDGFSWHAMFTVECWQRCWLEFIIATFILLFLHFLLSEPSNPINRIQIFFVLTHTTSGFLVISIIICFGVVAARVVWSGMMMMLFPHHPWLLLLLLLCWHAVVHDELLVQLAHANWRRFCFRHFPSRWGYVSQICRLIWF